MTSNSTLFFLSCPLSASVLPYYLSLCVSTLFVCRHALSEARWKVRDQALVKAQTVSSMFFFSLSPSQFSKLFTFIPACSD